MISLLRRRFRKQRAPSSSESDLPPGWTAAPERSHVYGLYNEATYVESEAAEQFCRNHPPDPPKLLPSHIVDRITELGCLAWGLEWPNTHRFAGRVTNISEHKSGGATVVCVSTEEACADACLLSDLPIAAGLYDTRGKTGVYFEVIIGSLGPNGVIAIGMW
jgi:Ran-binding protein 9/10